MEKENRNLLSQASRNKLKAKGKKTFIIVREWIMITIGLFMYALAWKGLLLPHQITGGGATGVAALAYYATGIPMFAIYLSINLVLLLVAIKLIGWQFSFRTIVGVGILTFFLSVIPEFDRGFFVNENEGFMATVLGGLMMGAGVGLVFLNNGSSGGTDIIAKVVNKYRNITPGRAILYTDVLIISSSYFLEFGSIEKIVYGLTTLAISTIAIDMVINGVRQSVQFFIFSKNYDEIATRINIDMHRGVTILDGMGWYSKEPMKVVTVVVRKNESISIFRIVKEIDPNAFISQASVIGVYGEGFDVIKSK